MSETEGTYLAPDGTRLTYRLQHSRHPSRGLVILLHGMASNMTRWSEFVERTSLTDHWNLLRLDLRGHAKSFARGKIGMAVWCEDLAGLLDSLGVERGIFVGHSLGAHLAMHAAARYPHRVRGLVLIDPVFPPALRGKMRIVRWCRPLLLAVAALIRFLNALGLRRRHFPHRDLRVLDERVREEFLSSGDARGFVSRYSSPTIDMKYLPVGQYIQEVGEILGPLPLPETIAAPMLILLSRAVTYTDPRITQQLLTRSRDATCETIDAYHWPLTEQPEQIRKAIEGWISRRFAASTNENPPQN